MAGQAANAVKVPRWPQRRADAAVPERRCVR
uniref:Uncharacterized protein n=1 Tax=Setaria viridis TaxID=4556 RepID=A0A4U6VMK6_SETVI|nr:hypothetical protein SEVIR_2G072750v2 [Setaria viridis]